MPDIIRKTLADRNKAAEGGAPAVSQPAAGRTMDQSQFSKASPTDPRKKPIPSFLMKKHIK